MRITDILAESRVSVDHGGTSVVSKMDALRVIAEMISPDLGVERQEVERLLVAREELQSTGIGDGVAIPHASLEAAPKRSAALLLCPRGIDFDSLDSGKVHIVIGVVGPKDATSEHLRALARVSRLLRDGVTRDALVAARSAAEAFQLIERRDASFS